MNCSYCETAMEITEVKVKRPAPRGSIDLDLYDDTTCWQCPKCKQTSDENLVSCACCRNIGEISYPNYLCNDSSNNTLKCVILSEDTVYGERFKQYICLKCLKCSECQKPFANGDNIKQVKKSLFDKDVAELTGDYSRDYRYYYTHKNCHQGQSKSEENKSGSTYSTQTTTREKSRKPLVIFFIIVAFVVWAIFVNNKGSNTRLKPSSTFVGKECNLRSTPSKGRNIIKTIPKGGSVTILENSGEWAKVRYINSEGYIKSNLLTH